ncbi:MAG: hypothetical protein ABF743_13785 [Schleiferilactobacillus perolens]
MRLGDFETAYFAGSKRRHSVPAPFFRRLRSFGTARKRRILFQSQLPYIVKVSYGKYPASSASASVHHPVRSRCGCQC